MGQKRIGLDDNYGKSPSAIKAELEKRTAKENEIEGKVAFQAFDKNQKPFGKIVKAQNAKIAKMLTEVPRGGSIRKL
jgi:YbbR domain-containing protein